MSIFHTPGGWWRGARSRVMTATLADGASRGRSACRGGAPSMETSFCRLSQRKTTVRHANARSALSRGAPAPAASRPIEPHRAREDVVEPLALLHPPRERVDDRPSAHPLTVELERLGELVEPAADPVHRVRLLRELVPAVAQQRGDVEGALADERLRVDGQPRIPLGAQDVAPVEVLVEQRNVV